MLSAEQLEAALRHEYVHRGAFDNFKRLAVLLAPLMFCLSSTEVLARSSGDGPGSRNGPLTMRRW